MRFALLAITAASLFAQSPEIRGSVVEEGTGTPLSGVEVILTFSPFASPRILGSVYTDAGGNFSFNPQAFGQYQLEVKKPGYREYRPGQVRPTSFLSPEFPQWRPIFLLVNPSTVTGRLVDEEDRPLDGFRVLLSDARPAGYISFSAATRADGSLTIPDVAPGTYNIHAVPATPEFPKIEPFTPEGFELLDRGWDDLSAPPFVVPPGGAPSLGTLRLRQSERYRVRLNIQGDCSGDPWTVAFINPAATPPYNALTTHRTPCQQQLLLTNIPPGTHQVALYTDDNNPRWAVAPLTVTRANTAVNLTIASATDVPGRILTSEGAAPPTITGTNFLLMMRPDIPGLSNIDAQEPQVQLDGTFVAHTLRWDHYRVSAPRVPAGYYVREIRYNGRQVQDGRIALIPNARLDFELDNQPARITGTLTRGGQPFTERAVILIAKAPYDVPTSVEGNAPFSYLAFAQDGRFDITGLSPGEYRIAVSPDRDQLPQLIATGEKITLERSQQRTVELKLK